MSRRWTRRRTELAAALAGLLAAASARADVILTAEALNSSLKNMERLRLRSAAGAAREGAESLFELGVAADALVALMNDEVAAHGMQEKALLDLGRQRAREIGVAIAWNAAKQRFFYDGEAFASYLARAPRGARVAEASFWMVENEFYGSSPDQPEALLAAAQRKREFLRRFPKFTLAADVAVFLAIDYRDLYRHYQEQGDAARRGRFLEQAKRQFREVMERHPGSDQARIAAEMLERLLAEARARQGG